MEVYRSLGASIIAALIGPDRSDREQPGSVDMDPSQAVRMQVEFRQIGRRCERAVVTTFCELRDAGTADPDAFRACITLYRIHHPEASAAEARRLVTEWVDHHVVRRDHGPTPGCECAGD